MKTIIMILFIIGIILISGCKQQLNQEEIIDTNPKTETVQNVPNLFVYSADSKIKPLFDDFPANVEQHKVEVRFDLLKDENIDTINLNLFDGFNYIVKRESIERNADQYIWVGKIPNQDYPDELGNSVTIVFSDEAISGSIPAIGSNKYAYSIGHPPEGQGSFMILTKIDPTKYPED